MGKPVKKNVQTVSRKQAIAMARKRAEDKVRRNVAAALRNADLIAQTIAANTAVTKPVSSPVLSYPLKPACRHTGIESVITLPNGMRIHGASYKDIVNVKPTTLIVNCTGNKDTFRTLQSTPRGFEALYRYSYNPAVICIDWPDGDSPNVDAEFWKVLVDTAHGQGFTDITAFCLGSHGRTGTALAAIAIANMGLTAKQAVDLIREKHCQSAVETYSQVNYLQDVAMFFGKYVQEEIVGSYHFPKKANDVPTGITSYDAETGVFNFGNH